MCQRLMQGIRMNSLGGARVANYGWIWARKEYLWTGHTYERRWRDFVWEGPPVAVMKAEMLTSFCERLPKVRDRVAVGPFVVRVIRADVERDRYWVRRVDQQMLAGWLLMWRLMLQVWLGRLERRRRWRRVI